MYNSSAMPTPLSPSSSQEIIPISPPLSFRSTAHLPESSTTLPVAVGFDPLPDLKPKIRAALKVQRAKEEGQGGKRKAGSGEVEEERKRVRGMERSRVTERMVGPSSSLISPCLGCEADVGVGVVDEDDGEGSESDHEF